MESGQINSQNQFIDLEVITLSKNGVWLSGSEEITHVPTIQAFFKSIRKDHLGYLIQIGKDSKRIEVEDTAYFITHLQYTTESVYDLRVSDDSYEPLDPQTLHYCSGRLTCKIKEGTEVAKFLNPAYIDLLQNIQEDTDNYYLEFYSDTLKPIKVSLEKKNF